ncbi:hypothetical protein EPUS_03234 [Endocarpon pusillum Z07020]|uniref:Uncharacterized protein n=1 Tax=Endocarpon pusillum (strain Z07020 / HMAS-L-300199) TaxID=1263415 RepID=U1HVV5_ENDPU|nr:uncharacterized protein EPUS_03234 [Endocarpon pusillum Z07020]ERF74850.1 hypothetical protein EPUS_03234 [Endocarpon pusillum Z07020]
MPINLNLAVPGSTAIETSGAASCEPLNMQTAPRTAHPVSPYISSGSATVSHPHNPSLPLSPTPAGNFRTVPRQRELRGGGRGNWRGWPTYGPYSWRNDIYVGRVSLPPVSDPKSFSPWKTDLDLNSRYLAAPKSPIDFFIPKIVHNPPLEAFDFGEQSETCTTWRGLSSVGAEELLTWTNIYHTVSKHRSNDSAPVNLSSVAVEMVELYEQGPPTGFNWFFSAPNIYQRLERFLSMSLGTPTLQTEELEVPVVGHRYTLMPCVRRSEQNLGDGFAGEIVYSTSESWLTFDKSSKVFTGIVPFAPPRNIIVKANVIEFLDERVHLEHVIRTKVYLRARVAMYPADYLTKIFTKPCLDHETDLEITKPRKQVSFADENDTDSLHSSPDHLRSFFNELSAMTCNPIHDKTSQQSAFSNQSRDAVCAGSGPFSLPNPFPEAQAGGMMSEESTTGFKSQDASAGAPDSPQRKRLAKTNSSVSPNLRRPCSEQGEPVCERTTSNSVRAVVSAEGRITERHVRARNPSCASYRMNNENLEKPFSFYDTDTDINFDVALGISCPGDGGLEEIPEPDYPRPLIFRNRFDSLSKCSNMDLPTQACDSNTDTESVSQPDDQQIMDDMAFGSMLSTIGLPNSGDIRHLKDFSDNLYQWNWKGWEKEIGITRYSHKESFMPGPCWDDSASATATVLLNGGLGDGGTERKVPIDSYEDTIRNEGAARRDEGFMGYGLLSPTLSSTTTDKAIRYPSKGSWSMEDDACVLTNATNCVDKTATLYQTVRDQFYKDHRIRQMSSAKNSKSFFTRGNLSSVFSSSSEHPEITHTKQHHMKEKLACYQSEKARQEGLSPSFPAEKPYVSSSNLVWVDEHQPNIGSIAVAVKNSFAVELQGQDVREKAEIRKGILHHQVMDLQRSEPGRNLSSSTYDDIFWSSDGASMDDSWDKGIA